MDGAAEIASEVAGAGTALAGLILVYLGAVAASYASYSADTQIDVRRTYRLQAWWAFAGVAISLAAAACGIISKANGSDCLATVAAGLLFLAFVWALLSALFTASGVS